MNYRSFFSCVSSDFSLCKKLYQGALFFGSSILAIKVAGLIKFSYMMGSYTGFFSGVNIAVPLAGAFSGALGGWSVFVARLLMGGFSAHYLAYTIPGFCASLYWAHNNFVMRCLVPALCIVAFVVHPVGGEAALYSAYWLIPMGLYFFPCKSIFFTALGSTFVAHAVGSVIWLYTVPMTATMWLALIPVVAVERLLFATGMVAVYKFVELAWARFAQVSIKLPLFYNTAKQ